MIKTRFAIEPIGVIRSELASLEAAPLQGDEGAPEACPWGVRRPAMEGTHLSGLLLS